MKRIAIIITVALLLAACGSEGGGTTQIEIVAPKSTTETAVSHTPTPVETQNLASPTPPQPESNLTIPTNGLAFNFQNAPILTKDLVESWGSDALSPGAVTVHNGLFHLFFNSSFGIPGETSVGYATSIDGINWDIIGEDPILTVSDVPTQFTFDVTDVIVEADGSWTLYFNIQDDRLAPPRAIGRATAPAPEGPWAVETDPILTVGSEGTWDGFGIYDATVVIIDDAYRLYYAAQEAAQSNKRAVGLATSPNGITWTKHDDPATIDDLWTESDPVFTLNPDREFIGDGIFDPNVVSTPNGLWMTYLFFNPAGTRGTVGYAFSEDGMAWTAVPDTAGLVVEEREEWQLVFNVAATYKDDTYYIYLNPRTTFENKTDLFVATFTGPIK
ncbi:MAG: hypothetical protein GY943_07415 [Chloroflexi bacterium]|nr:hypothetical protein [Chloroflexota bacterium]